MPISRLPTLASSRSSEKSSRLIKTKSKLPDSPFLPKISGRISQKDEDETLSQEEDEAQREERMRVKEYERELSEHQATLDALPQINAEFVQNIDFFAKFLDDNHIDVADLNEFAKFAKFCEVHADFENKQKLYYALLARNTVKLRQIDVVKNEMKSFQVGASVLDTITSNTGQEELTQDELSSEFSHIIEKYSEKSFQLCLLKSKEEHASTKFRLLKAKADRNADPEEEYHLIEEQNLQKIYIAVLDALIYELL